MILFLIPIFTSSVFFSYQTYAELEYSDQQIPNNFLIWLEKLVNWLENDLISEQEFSNVIDYLSKNGIIPINSDKLTDLEPTRKNKSILTMIDFTSHRFNEGAPIVFQGKLVNFAGYSISNANVVIKSDGPCPSNHIIGKGITDKHGRYKILTHGTVWNEENNLITTFAEFPGNDLYESSVSDTQIVIVYPVKGEKCIG